MGIAVNFNKHRSKGNNDELNYANIREKLDRRIEAKEQENKIKNIGLTPLGDGHIVVFEDYDVAEIEVTSDECIKCKEEVNEEDWALECDKCNRWQHIMCGNIIGKKKYIEMTTGKMEIDWKCAECKKEEKISKREKEDNRRKKRRNRGKMRMREKKVGETKIAMFNIEGRTRRNWEDIENHARQRKWDIICITETH